MTKIHIYVFYAFIATIIPIATFGQELQVKSFELLNRDITARTKRVNDANGQMCALVRVNLPVENCKFVGNVIQQSYDVNEYLVYMPDKSKWLQVECPGFKALRIELTTADGIDGVESGRTYSLKLYGYEGDNTNSDEHLTFIMENQGEAEAQYALGVSYEYGQGVKQNYKEAVKYYRKAAEQGHAAAQYNLGVCYRDGKGTKKDYKEAIALFRKAEEQGVVQAQTCVGACYEHGLGVKKDYNEAVKWYRKAAEQGEVFAQVNLAGCYYNGFGVPQSYSEAITWFRKAAEQGFSIAQYNLGVCYEYGKGVTKDYNEAAKWYRKAAEQGHVEAAEQLRNLHR